MSVTIAINLQPHKPTVDQSGIIFENILKFILLLVSATEWKLLNAVANIFIHTENSVWLH